MLLTKTVKVKWSPKTIKHYKNLGYKFTKLGDEFEVKVEDLTHGSNIYVKIKCDGCGETLKPMKWVDYLIYIHENEKYYCQSCSNNLFGKQKRRKNQLKNSISFEQWCYNNLSKEKAEEILSRWDYDKNIDKNGNIIKPSEISFSSHELDKGIRGYWFKCLKHLEHESELKDINSYVHGRGNLSCNQCNSFAQWGIDNDCEDFLDKYWDWKKNNELDINPWEIAPKSHKKIFIKCQEKDYHKSYDIICSRFVCGDRCSYCHSKGRLIHPKDSLGQHIVDNYGQEFLDKIWSKKNKKSPFEYTFCSGQEVWWKCIDNKHDDYYRKISTSNLCNFRCPECQFYKGEKRIEEWLVNNNIKYIPQKKFKGLIGLGGGNLSYDFYLPNYNLLIEYQGLQHEKPIDFKGEGIKKAKQQFEKQQEHDRRKKEYADKNNIKLLPIWYWDYDNIENILNRELLKRGDENRYTKIIL